MDALLLASTVLILATACLLAMALPIHLHNRRILIRLRAAQRSANSHIQKSRMDLLETRNRARLLEDTIKQGTSAVEKMHKAIAATTFSLIDHFATDEQFRESARRARETHNNSSNQFYKAARTTNKALHLLADTLFISRREKQLTSRRSEDRDRPPRR
jgi:septal ring factor EnvC (AmiA/AmiB activator)